MQAVKQGRRVLEQLQAREAAARAEAEREQAAERAREAGFAEELRVIDTTRFGEQGDFVYHSNKPCKS